jgi:hypothetical protein
MAYDVFPVSDIVYPWDEETEVGAVVHSFGDIYEQPREDGVGNQKTFIGRRRFFASVHQLPFRTDPYPGNANLDNSVEAVWDFFIDQFYSTDTGLIKWNPFYLYDPMINSDRSTWTGDSTSNGTNDRSEAVTNETGRYLVRLAEPRYSKSYIKRCLTSIAGLEFIECSSS